MTTNTTQNASAPTGAGAPPPGGTAPAGGTAAPPADAISEALALEAKKTEGDKKPAPGDEKKPAGETKPPPEDKKPEAKDGDKKDEKPALEVKVPEGFNVDAKALDAFKATATELGLDSAKTQKLFDQFVGFEKARNDAAEKAYAEQNAKWQAELKADPELGGDKWPTTVRNVRAGVEFVGKDVGELLARVGLGSNKIVVKALERIGRANADDTVSGTEKSPPKGEPLSDVELFYGPKTKKEP